MGEIERVVGWSWMLRGGAKAWMLGRRRRRCTVFNFILIWREAVFRSYTGVVGVYGVVELGQRKSGKEVEKGKNESLARLFMSML